MELNKVSNFGGVIYVNCVGDGEGEIFGSMELLNFCNIMVLFFVFLKNCVCIIGGVILIFGKKFIVLIFGNVIMEVNGVSYFGGVVYVDIIFLLKVYKFFFYNNIVFGFDVIVGGVISIKNVKFCNGMFNFII